MGSVRVAIVGEVCVSFIVRLAVVGTRESLGCAALVAVIRDAADIAEPRFTPELVGPPAPGRALT